MILCGRAQNFCCNVVEAQLAEKLHDESGAPTEISMQLESPDLAFTAVFTAELAVNLASNLWDRFVSDTWCGRPAACGLVGTSNMRGDLFGLSVISRLDIETVSDTWRGPCLHMSALATCPPPTAPVHVMSPLFREFEIVDRRRFVSDSGASALGGIPVEPVSPSHISPAQHPP